MENRTDELTPAIPVTPAAPATPKTPEHIEHEMLLTRQSMTEKVSALESQVVGTVQSAADTMTSTVGAVKSLMDTAPGAVGESMKQAASAVGDKVKEVFNLSGHVESHPWASVVASAGVGFITGLLVFRDRTPAPVAPLAAVPVYAPPPTPASPSMLSGLFNDLLSMVGKKVKELAETAVESASTAANQTVRESIPKLMDASPEATESTRFNGVRYR